MDSSTKLLRDDPSLYSGSCGVVDTTIQDLDQQIILNDMILFANGGMPYMYQDPAGLSSNNPPPPVVGDRGILPPPWETEKLTAARAAPVWG
ncbi:hypothetical protein PG993_010213 [Apiospora rasikravindrae]|uniref:Uncharacterized protein n=1 Tax=Apiospora rasikravindrae TaxID=990691 RepID=A0ABR1SLL8_9PEZI